jgi:hypothetical protein
MEPLLYVMAILGCGESDAACQQIRVEPTTYASQAECLAATEAALMRNSDVPYPNFVAQCRPSNQSPQLLRGSDVMRPAGGRLPERPRYAAGRGPVARF